MRSRPLKFLFLTFAMLSLSFSAVAACACTHHWSKKAESEPLSCHNKPHEEPTRETANVDPGTSRFNDQCSCYVRSPEAAIIAKSESKPTKADKLASLDKSNTPQIGPVVVDAGQTALAAFEPSNLHSNFFSRSGPSRAPPRL